MKQILQYQFRIAEPVDTNDAYRLYSALLRYLPKDLAAELHDSPARPISQYVWGNYWVVSIMGTEACEKCETYLDRLECLFCTPRNRKITLTLFRKLAIQDVTQLLYTELPQVLELSFLTPTAFKHKGEVQLLPTQRMLLQSLLRRWNDCFSDTCPIENAEDGLDALAEGVVYRGVHIDTVQYAMKGQSMPGITGSILLSNRLKGEEGALLSALLHFATFAGIGIKTGLGMGGAAILFE